jgi:CubicO group peptidase (beta-lactamase class C family)
VLASAAALARLAPFAEARSAGPEHAPGSFWYYNNWDFNALGTIFRQLTSANIFEALEARIAGPIGMEDVDIRQAAYALEPESTHPATGSASPRATSRDSGTCILKARQ